MEKIKILNTFKFSNQVTLGEARTQVSIRNKIEKLKELADTYNFYDEPLTLRLFGDIKSGLGFMLDCDNKNTQQAISKTLKMYLDNCSD